MNYFLTELLSKTSTNNIFKDVDFIDKDNLVYKKVYESIRIHTVLAYCHIYKNMFGIYPSKLDIPESVEINFEGVFKHITFNTIRAYIQDTSNIALLKAKYDKYVSELKDPFFVKKELFNMIKNRFQTDVTYDHSKTLFQLYKELIVGNEYDVPQEYKYTCIFTGNCPSLINPINDEHDALTIIDTIKYITTKDYCFLKELNDKNVLVSSHDLKDSFKVLNNPVQIRNFEYLECIPKLAKKCIIVENVDKIITKNQNDTLFVKDFNGPHQALDFYVSTCIKEYLQIPRSINIPSLILKHMFKLNKEKGEYIQSNTNSNSILIIDGRKNIMSIISAEITLSFLKQRQWTITIVTPKSNFEFYMQYFPNAIYLTHPLQEKQDNFNMEDYNMMLKTPLLWKMLSDKDILNVLLVQDDGFLIKHGMEDEFFIDKQMTATKYAYLAAPWPEAEHLRKANSSLIGNGGLSLRRIETMLEITNNATKKDINALFNANFQPIPEDVFFSKHVDRSKLPTVAEASLFSSEMILNPKSYGIHKPWGYFPIPEIIEKFLT